jgi:predicted PhzF superfamily epimerase YddE/YHI9
MPTVTLEWKPVHFDLWHVDAFAERASEGNPAAVCRLSQWLDDRHLQAVAEENISQKQPFLCKKADVTGSFTL